MPSADDVPTGLRSRLSRNVFALGAVSFFTDVATEMMYPLLPLFLATVLGASASFVGVIEGSAESVAALLKLFSGWYSDRVGSRRWLVIVGYGLASIVRPFTAIARTASAVLAIRVTDRVGKGIRSTPRDALIAESVDASVRGRAFGFHAAADNAGAMVGPLIAYVLISRFALSLRSVFWWTAVPGAIAMLVLIAFVRETPREARADAARTSAPKLVGAGLPRKFWTFLAIVLVFTLGNSTDAFLLLRARQLGVPIALLPVLWAAFNGTKAALGTWGGSLSDRLGRRPLMIAGWLVYAAVYAAFAFATHAWQAWALFGAYAVFYAATEGTEKAFVVDVVDRERRGTALGWYNLTVGIAALPASLLFGAIWDRIGVGAAFITGASLGGAAALALLVFGNQQQRAPGRS